MVVQISCVAGARGAQDHSVARFGALVGQRKVKWCRSTFNPASRRLASRSLDGGVLSAGMRRLSPSRRTTAARTVRSRRVTRRTWSIWESITDWCICPLCHPTLCALTSNPAVGADHRSHSAGRVNSKTITKIQDAALKTNHAIKTAIHVPKTARSVAQLRPLRSKTYGVTTRILRELQDVARGVQRQDARIRLTISVVSRLRSGVAAMRSNADLILA